MIHVIATITVHPGKRHAFLDEFHRVVPLVRAEDGCLAYAPTIDAATDISKQGPQRPDTVVIIERWSDLARLKAHLVAPHMEAYRAQVKDLVASSQLQVLEQA